MSNIEVKRFLRRYEYNEDRIKELEEELELLQERATSVSSPQLSDMPRGGVKKTKEDIIAEIDILERRVDRLIVKRRALKEEIEMVIDDLGDPKLCKVLDLYYIEFKTLEQIADEMCYTVRYVGELYHKALNAIVLPVKNECV